MGAYGQNIVLDLEFTPVGAVDAPEGLAREVIQWGAVRVDLDGRLQDRFETMVKPDYAPGVSTFVSHLTGLRDGEVFRGVSFAEALERFRQWVGPRKTRFVTWSSADLTQLTHECDAKGLAFPEGEGRWADIQRVYPRVMGIELGDGPMGLRDAAEHLGLSVDETRFHGAPYDAQVTAEILESLLTGAYRAHRGAMARAQSNPAPTVSLGEKFAELLSLKQSLEAAEQAALAS